jgi:protein involved in polysaccharide export with SLBB domain
MSRFLGVLSGVLVGLTFIAPPPVVAQDLSTLAVEVPELVTPGVQPGDHVTLTLYNQNGDKLTDIGGQRTVDGRGLLYLPFLEEVQVRGMTQDALRDHLDAAYEEFLSNSVVEVVVEYRVNITGTVRQPGTVFLTPDATLTDALASAGGPSSETDTGLQGGAADASRVSLTRVGYQHPIIINFRPIEANPDVINAPVQSGDWIHVPVANRSKLRDQFIFAGNLLSVLLGTVSLILIISQK